MMMQGDNDARTICVWLVYAMVELDDSTGRIYARA